MARTYDAIVIGGGVIGASTAFHLAKAGVGRVALVERRTLGSGNTRKSGAIVRMHYSNDPEARLALASLPYFQHWSEVVGGSCGFRPTGFAILVGPENEARLARNVARLRTLGAETSVVRPHELREIDASPPDGRRGRRRVRADQRLRRRGADDALIRRGGAAAGR